MTTASRYGQSFDTHGAGIEVDCTGAGRMDQWHCYRDGALSLADQDTSGDGTIDRIIHHEGHGQLAQV